MEHLSDLVSPEFVLFLACPVVPVQKAVADAIFVLNFRSASLFCTGASPALRPLKLPKECGLRIVRWQEKKYD